MDFCVRKIVLGNKMHGFIEGKKVKEETYDEQKTRRVYSLMASNV